MAFIPSTLRLRCGDLRELHAPQAKSRQVTSGIATWMQCLTHDGSTLQWGLSLPIKLSYPYTTTHTCQQTDHRHGYTSLYFFLERKKSTLEFETFETTQPDSTHTGQHRILVLSVTSPPLPPTKLIIKFLVTLDKYEYQNPAVFVRPFDSLTAQMPDFSSNRYLFSFVISKDIVLARPKLKDSLGNAPRLPTSAALEASACVPKSAICLDKRRNRPT